MQSQSIDGARGGHPVGSILVVEDDDDTRLALADALTDLGHAVAVDVDGETALERLERSSFDAVLADVRMPGMDGIELCRRLSDDRPSLPVLVMTAYGDVDSAMGALRAGACDFITKPLSLARLATALERALSQGEKSRIVVSPTRAASQEDRPSAAVLHDPYEAVEPFSLDEIERRHILHVLRALDGNKAEAARVLGINRATLYRKLERYGLEPDEE